MLSDDRRAWLLGTDDIWRRAEDTVEQPSGLGTFETLMRAARAGAAPAEIFTLR